MYNHINFFDLNKLGQNKNQLEGLCSIGRTKTKSGRAETDKSK